MGMARGKGGGCGPKWAVLYCRFLVILRSRAFRAVRTLEGPSRILTLPAIKKVVRNGERRGIAEVGPSGLDGGGVIVPHSDLGAL